MNRAVRLYPSKTRTALPSQGGDRLRSGHSPNGSAGNRPRRQCDSLAERVGREGHVHEQNPEIRARAQRSEVGVRTEARGELVVGRPGAAERVDRLRGEGCRIARKAQTGRRRLPTRAALSRA